MAGNPQKLVQLAAVRKSLKSLINFLRPAVSFLNIHTNDFFAHEVYSYLHEKLQRDLDAVSVSQMRNYMNILASTTETASNNDTDGDLDYVNFKESSLDDLISRISQLLLHKNMNLSSVYMEDVLSYCGGGHQNDCIKGRGGTIHRKVPQPFCTGQSGWNADPEMKLKKLHEVEVMGDFTTQIQQILSKSVANNGSSFQNFDYLIDVGSGKGYLSNFLAHLRNFRVLAIDSKLTNTQGSVKRSNKMQKNVSHFLQHASGNQANQAITYKQRREKYRAKNVESKKSLQNQTTITTSHRHDDGHTEDVPNCQLQCCTQNDNKNEQHAVDSPTTQQQLTTDDNKGSEEEEGCCDNLKNVTLFVSRDLDLLQLLRDNFSDQRPRLSYGLIGLHTCGDLGVETIKLFLKFHEAKFMLNVPCCYHFLEESYCPDWELHSSIGARPLLSFAVACPTFPLSQNLHEERFYLGHNARMMSSQSLHRMSLDTDEEPPKTLLFRSMLQYIIKKKLNHTKLQYTVGRIANKCANFQDYVRKALVNLHLENDVQISDEEIEQMRLTCEAQSERFHKFFLLRSLFAPLVEGCILLDRLSYLLEEEETKAAYLVEIFDPLLSPRCYALVAFK